MGLPMIAERRSRVVTRSLFFGALSLFSLDSAPCPHLPLQQCHAHLTRQRAEIVDRAQRVRFVLARTAVKRAASGDSCLLRIARLSHCRTRPRTSPCRPCRASCASSSAGASPCPLPTLRDP